MCSLVRLSVILSLSLSVVLSVSHFVYLSECRFIFQVCKVISCSEEPLSDFVLPNTDIDYDVIDKPNIFGLNTWKKYMNPSEW